MLQTFLMALYAVLKKFEAMDKRGGRIYNGPTAEQIIRPSSSTSTITTRSKKNQPPPRRRRRQRRPASAMDARSTRTNQRTRRPASAMASLRTSEPRLLNKRVLTKGAPTSNEYGKEFYFLRISLGLHQKNVIVDVTVTDLTHPDRPSHVYRALTLDKKRNIKFRDLTLENFQYEKKNGKIPSLNNTLTVISPVDDFDFVTEPAQLLGHTLRICVVSVAPHRQLLVDTCCHFAGRNPGRSLLLSRQRNFIERSLDKNDEGKKSDGDGGGGGGGGGEERKKRWKEEQRKRMAAKTRSLDDQTIEEIQKRRSENEQNEKKQQHEVKRTANTTTTNTKMKMKMKTTRSSSTEPRLHNNSPNFRTKNVASRRTRRRPMSPMMNGAAAMQSEKNDDDNNQVLSPRTASSDARSNLSLNIKQCKEDIERRRAKSMLQARKSLEAGPAAADVRQPLRLQREGTMKYQVDPDQLLRDLAGVDTSASSEGLRGWSPKHSRKRSSQGVDSMVGQRAHMSKNLSGEELSSMHMHSSSSLSRRK